MISVKNDSSQNYLSEVVRILLINVGCGEVRTCTTTAVWGSHDGSVDHPTPAADAPTAVHRDAARRYAEKRSAHRQEERDRERQRGRHHKLSQAQPSAATHVPRDLA